MEEYDKIKNNALNILNMTMVATTTYKNNKNKAFY